MNHAIIYARVSTDEQSAKGYSLPSQLEACREYAQRNGFAVLPGHEFSDDYSGAKLQRPQFDKARDVLRRGEAGALIVYASDRLTRNLAHWLLLREEFTKLGIELHYVRRGKSEDTAEARMMENIEGVFAEYERAKIIERTTRGMWRKAKEGRYVGNGVPPYGYRVVGIGKDAHLEIDEDKAKVVRIVFRWCIEGMSNVAIAKRLGELGIPSPHAHRRNHKRAAHCWTPGIVRRMLINEAYRATFYFGRRTNGKWRDKSEWLALNVPAIVDYETWNAAQKQRERNRHSTPANAQRRYLLSGMLRCSCGAAMTGVYHAQNDLRYYQCSRQAQQHRGLEAVCPQKWVRADAVEALVWNDLDALMANAKDFERALIEARDHQLAQQKPKRDDLDSVERAIARCEADMRDYIQQRRGATTPLHQTTLDDLIAQCEKQYAELTAERVKLEGELSKAVLTDEDIGDLMQLREDIVEGIQEPDFETMRGVLQDLECAVKVTGKKLNIQYAIGTGSATIERMPRRSGESSQGTGQSRPTLSCPLTIARVLSLESEFARAMLKRRRLSGRDIPARESPAASTKPSLQPVIA